MELYHLRTFVTVAEEGHLTRASERLFISQPSVSAHVKALEEELGLPLFRRTPKGMLLTPEGRVLLEHARQALDAAGGLLFKARSLRREVRGTLRLGLNTDSVFLRVSRLAALLDQRHPQVELSLNTSVTGRIMEALRAGSLDAGFVFHESDPVEFSFLRLCSFRLLIMGPAVWRERIERAGWAELARLPWIWTPPHCPCYQLGEEMFKRRKLNLTKTIESDNESVVNDLIIAGKGISLVREDDARTAEAAGLMVRWPREAIPLHAYLVSLPSRADDPLLVALRSAVADVWKPESENVCEDALADPLRGATPA
ncbi:MAG: LysR family transcriptional regulator [Desulfovibrio sp.]